MSKKTLQKVIVTKRPWTAEHVPVVYFEDDEKSSKYFKEKIEPILGVLSLLGMIQIDNKNDFYKQECSEYFAKNSDSTETNSRGYLSWHLAEQEKETAELLKKFKPGDKVLIKEEEDEVYHIAKVYQSGVATLEWMGEPFGHKPLGELILEEDWQKEQLTDNEECGFEERCDSSEEVEIDREFDGNTLTISYDLRQCGIYLDEGGSYSLCDVIYLSYKDSLQYGEHICFLTEEEAEKIKNIVRIRNF